MKINYKFTTVILLAVVAALVATVGVLAGNIDSSAAPAATNSYGLDDLYNRLNSGAAGSQSAWAEPSAGPGSTMNTIDDIMAVAPAVDDTDGATAADVYYGTTFWGLTSGGWGLQTGTGVPGGVPKTGDAYNDACCTGEDGELQKGTTWPNPRFTDNSDGTVTDNLTGLIWLKNADCPDTTRIWSTALSDVAQLNTNGTMNSNNCGDTSNGGSHQTDWRLPNVRELHSLIHYGYIYPALPNTAGTGQWTAGDPFTNVRDYYWSSTSRTWSSAWSVALNLGDMSCDPKTVFTFYVWPVRGGQ